MAKQKPGGAITTDSIYYSQAQKEIDPSYNAKVTAMNNALASQQQALEQQKGGVNGNFDTMVSSQNRNNNLSKNNLSNQMLGRGLGRSSIVTSGMAQQDQINNRMVGDIENQRQGALSDIDARKSLLAENNASALAQLEADKINEYYKLARQLQDRDVADWYNERNDNRQQQSMEFDQSYKNQQLAWQKEAQRQELAYKQQALAQQQAMQGAQLAWQKEQAGWERDYKQQQLADAKRKEQLGLMGDMMSSYQGIMSSDYNNSQKANALDLLEDRVAMYSNNGYWSQGMQDFSGKINNSYDQLLGRNAYAQPSNVPFGTVTGGVTSANSSYFNKPYYGSYNRY